MTNRFSCFQFHHAFVIAIALTCISACNHDEPGFGVVERHLPEVLSVKKPTAVLFIGNSFTFYNDGIEQHLQRLAASASPAFKLTVGQRTTPNQTFAGHYRDPRTEQAIVAEAWDIVILQGASNESLAPKTRDSFFDYAQLLSQRARVSGATPAFFMTWAYYDRPSMITALRDSYVIAGNSAGALVVPVALAFDRVRTDRSNRYLYSDNKHPSIAGTYLAACVFYASLFNRTPEGLEYVAGLDLTEALYLQRVAWESTESFYRRRE